MRHYVRQNIKRGRCSALNQNYKSAISDEVLSNISKELNINGNKWGVLHKYFENTNKQRKTLEDEYDSQYKDYRDNDQKERAKCFKKKNLTTYQNYQYIKNYKNFFLVML